MRYCSAELPLRLSARAAPPSEPSLLFRRLRARERRRVLSSVNGRCHESKRLGAGGALQAGDLRLFEDGGECNGTLVSDVVYLETASEGRAGS